MIQAESDAAPAGGDPSAAPAVEAAPVLRRLFIRVAALAIACASVTVLCVLSLVRGGTPRAEGFVPLLVGAAAIACVTAAFLLHRGFFRRIVAVDAARREGAPPPAVLETALAQVVDAPRYWFVRSLAWFVAGGVAVSSIRHVASPEAFPPGFVAQGSVSAISGGFLLACILFFLLKRGLAPLREQLARDLGDPEVARSLIRPVSLKAKLVVGVSGALLVATLYGVALGQVRAGRTAESTAVHLAGRLLDELGAGVSPERVREQAWRLELADAVRIVDPQADPELAALEGELAGFERAALGEALAAGRGGGDSLDLLSPHHFAWRRLADGRVALVTSDASRFAAHAPGMNGPLGVLLVLVVLVAGGVSWLLATDTERALSALGREVERLASGDLRRGRPFLWEDELGGLAGRLERMTGGLREMVRSVSGTAGRVEAAAGGIADASRSLVDTGRAQAQGIESIRGSLAGVSGQVDGITASARDLARSVEEGSSSILELRSAGQSLDESAVHLNEKVDEVSSALDELVRSVRDVMGHAEHLTGAAVDTSSSMEEMAASLREVDANATETARISQSVAEDAERGREQVYQTLQGMEGIEATIETARKVIHGLGGRTKEIGAIVNVIDDVAEETNLLALNAAIIAAQAGEGGRAFGVVADQIKELADRVLSSTKEIEQVIVSVQEESANAVGAIDEGARVAGGGVKQAAEAGGALDAITGSARDAGTRIAEIVAAVGEQTKAAVHVVSLMERVRTGVEHIRRAGREQDRGNEAMLASAEAMREIARQVRRTTSEQSQGSGRLAEGVEAVRSAAGTIDGALGEQGEACRAVEAELERVREHVHAHGGVAEELDEAVGTMRREARQLREDVARFRL